MRLAGLLVVVLVSGLVGTAHAGLTQVASFGDNPGALDMYEYVPAGLPAGAPLVVVLHGCTQGATDIEAAGWDAIADAHQLAVLYPQQRAANQPLRCFDWYTPADTTRGQGEARSIVEMVDQMIAAQGVDPARVYVTGISAGGAFTAVLMATYPDRFAAGSVMSGVAYGCATDVLSGSSCEQGTQKAPQVWGDLVRAADSGYTGPWPRVQIWQGDQDTTVAPADATALVAQWTDVHGAAQTATATEAVGAATHTRYGDAVEEYVVAGMGHAISIGGSGCPSRAGAFFEDHQLCATLYAADFFGVLAGSGSGSGSGSGAGSGSGSGSTTSDGGGCAVGGGAPGAVLALAALLVYRRRGWGARSRMPCRRPCRFD